MSLTVYDHNQGCTVLNPEEFTPIINAFHPDYVKTYMPEFMSGIRSEAMHKANGSVGGVKNKAKREAKNKAAFTVVTNAKHPIRAAHLHRPNLAPTEFHIYNKAGMPKGVKK